MDRAGQPRGFSSAGFAEAAPDWSTPTARVDAATIPSDGPLGAARAQVHENYIIAQTPNGIVLVDQHAAHERLVYERLKSAMAENCVARQALLIPEIVTLGADADALLDHAAELERFGLLIEPFGPGTIAVRETPAILGEINAEALLRDILDELSDLGDSQTLQARVEAVLSRVACHGSIRSGRQMRADEMNALLREMEATPMSGQCNHGRPTYVELKLADIERLFGRT
jgi:DNA mismatch repair protein MutL